ncbi:MULTISPECIES: glycosyltransferase family 2 protein [Providencia]|uniref:glycosyltransferase family 2 protein n=1 Tax=Providencia TaxID=586 RepID=UPI001419D2A5|nr:MULTISPECIES: glycosyltransferase family 2 protein [Providencia]ELR5146633.1 glycosyltransferase family 2 protein [Providencia rettgeri]NIA44656.1 glycosyltransferase family 2 protein [Providencia rettgeri]NIA96916.1 glycosyltransferase family 2 protein [Providencia rettgeri]NIB14740.1 glycosyltransferase family 2 protein [Providencia rettgeri]NIB34952.1 glycosyltransferase family 2 protein [Providencia rettgeri]
MISIIIPCFNDADSLMKNIPSTLDFCKKINGEVIVINDGSTDSLSEDIKEINHPNLIYLEQENQGVSASRNNGMNIAKNKKILFLDSDDYINYDSLYSQMEKVNKYDIVYWDTKKIFSNKKSINYVIENKNKDELLQSILLRRNHLFIGSFIVSKKLALDILFDTKFKYGEDLKFIYEIIDQSGTVAKLDNIFLYYIQRNQSSMYRFNNSRFDSLDALESVRINKKFNQHLAYSIKYDKKVILHSFIKSFSILEFRKKLTAYSKMDEIIKSKFGNNKTKALFKLFIYSILYKTYAKLKP